MMVQKRQVSYYFELIVVIFLLYRSKSGVLSLFLFWTQYLKKTKYLKKDYIKIKLIRTTSRLG